ncbi:MAG: BRO family protein [Desulfovibrio sp.]|uniref:BRO-N domain-containing protein n=1 Tax=Desulfovibrio sp. TaxID=885 RepID=UPI002A361E2F|nr:BRO family protein [Desulfovibrio sp.]MDY0258511.1 BRO family protein [Desulfovibrio sp.]
MSQAQLLASPFQFNDFPIRTQVEGDQLWFSIADVCKALDITWSGATLKLIPSDWQKLLRLNNFSTSRSLRFISEPAVYKLAFRSNKPEADAFTNWIASEVVPAIRKTGKYEAKPAPRKKALGRGVTALPVPEAAPYTCLSGDVDPGRKDAMRRIQKIIWQLHAAVDVTRMFTHPKGRIPMDTEHYDIMLSLFRVADANLVGAYNALEAGHKLGTMR